LHKPYPDPKKDEAIVANWMDMIGKERILLVDKPKACVDVMLGAIAITNGTRTLQEYIRDMEDRG